MNPCVSPIDHALVDRLRREHCSCVIRNATGEEAFYGRGVSDLYGLLCERPHLLRGASVADKVVGKGAAALMILGGVERLYAEVISRPALALIARSTMQLSYAKVVEQIMNRTQTDRCPVERRCQACQTAEECLIEIQTFMNSK
uniref:DUF1893 domain-containing protein n=1 Tax=Alistipes sp. TaxID=1872444 RepID=UPI00405787D8